VRALFTNVNHGYLYVFAIFLTRGLKNYIIFAFHSPTIKNPIPCCHRYLSVCHVFELLLTRFQMVTRYTGFSYIQLVTTLHISVSLSHTHARMHAHTCACSRCLSVCLSLSLSLSLSSVHSHIFSNCFLVAASGFRRWVLPFLRVPKRGPMPQLQQLLTNSLPPIA
jgi:hypothetical protein